MGLKEAILLITQLLDSNEKSQLTIWQKFICTVLCRAIDKHIAFQNDIFDFKVSLVVRYFHYVSTRQMTLTKWSIRCHEILRHFTCSTSNSAINPANQSKMTHALKPHSSLEVDVSWRKSRVQCPLFTKRDELRLAHWNAMTSVILVGWKYYVITSTMV